MKTFLLILALVSTNGFAAQLPFGPSEEAAILAIQSRQLPSSAKGVVRAVWDVGAVSVNGDSTTNSGVHPLGVTLPKGALITDSYMYVETSPIVSASALNGVLGFQCEDANNILDQTRVDTFESSSFYAGKQRGMSTVVGGKIGSGAVASIANGCDVSAKVTVGAFSAGKITLFLEYVLATP